MTGALALGAAGPALAGGRSGKKVLRLRGFRIVEISPEDWRAGGSAILFLPVVAGPCAPIHFGLARRLAAAGHRVLTPELPERAPAERARDIAEILALAVQLGAGSSRLGVVGYDGGAEATRLALSANAAIRAGVICPGPLLASPVSRPRSGADPGPEPRLLVQPGCADVKEAEAALATGLAWLSAHGAAPLS